MPDSFVHFTVRLPRTLIEHIEASAREQRQTRSEWIRNAIRAYCDWELQRAQLEALEKRLSAQLDRVQQTILQHVTAEINDLTRE